MTDWMREALAVLEQGGVVAAATESVFGLLADATRLEAVERVLAVKARSEEKGMPLLLPNREAWAALVLDIPPLAGCFADAFWPGALTIALPAAAGLHERILLGGTVAVRLPGDSPAARLARALGRPLTATSANPPGGAATTDPDVVARAFAPALASGALHVVREPGPRGSVSTVLVVRGDSYQIVRVGAISSREIERVAAAR